MDKIYIIPKAVIDKVQACLTLKNLKEVQPCRDLGAWGIFVLLLAFVIDTTW